MVQGYFDLLVEVLNHAKMKVMSCQNKKYI